MKAERRHELQKSDLAKVIKQAPTFWQQSGGKYLLLIVAALVVGLLIRYRISSNREAAQQAIESISNARTLVSELRSPRMIMMGQFAPASETAMRRRQIYSEANNAINEATRLSDDRTVAAEALIARGDLDWALLQLPEIPGAATQPGAQIKDPRELMANAAEAYRAVVTNFSDVKHAQLAARFGLAAIAENQRKWDEAKQQYEAIKAETAQLGAYHQLAEERLNVLPKLQEPILLAPPASEPAAVTMPTTLGVTPLPPLIAAPKPATMPTTMRATTMSSATTKPTTKPVP